MGMHLSKYLEKLSIFEDIESEYKIMLNRDDVEGWMKSFVGFANCSGGTLFIGVHDNGYAVGIPNKKIDSETRYINDKIRKKINPEIKYSIKYLQVDSDNSVIAIKVEPSDMTPIAFIREDKTAVIYVRVTGETVIASPATIIELARRTNRYNYDQQVTNYLYKDYSFNSLNEKYKERRNIESDITVKEMKSVGMITEDGYLTNAGILFSDNCINQESRIHCRKWPGFDRSADFVIDDKEFQGNIIDLIDFGLKFIKSNTKTGYIKEAHGRTDVNSYPARALEEALVNACAHRDYQIQGSQIDVDIFQNRLVITSPGDFLFKGNVQDYNLEDLMSKRRNKLISDILFMCRLMEKGGTGFEKVLGSYKPYGLKYKPVAYSNEDFFRITLMDLSYDQNENLKVTPQATPQATPQVPPQVNSQVAPQETINGLEKISPKHMELLKYCEIARSREEMMSYVDLKDRKNFVKNYIDPLISLGLITMTIPNKPNSSLQKYIRVKSN